jgi:FkbM family methyltransferase
MDKKTEIVKNHCDYELNFKGVNLIIKDGVFTPDPKITNSSSIVINNLPNIKGKDILDIGCGTGIIGIYCALNGAKKVLAIDINKEAIENTKENIKRNKVKNIMKVKQSDLFNNVTGKFDYIIANLPIDDKYWNLTTSTTDLLKKCISESNKFIKKGGKLYFTWYSDMPTSPLIDYLNQKDYKFKRTDDKKLGRTWYLFEIQF